jgi:pimeloyl-ACP methyl ester carboxylesterase
VLSSTLPASRPRRTSRLKSSFAKVNGLDLYHEVHGDGDPLVLLHGALGTIDTCFGRLIPSLAKRRKVVAVELQGHGHTRDAGRPLTYDQMAEDTAALLRYLGIARADIFGYSMGGGIALEVAIRYPDLARKLVFAGGACYRADGFYPELRDALDTPSSEALVGSVWHRAYLEVAPEPQNWQALVAKTGDLDRSFVGWRAEDLESMKTPVLLLIGDSDLVRPEHTVEMFRLLGGGVVGDLVDMPTSQLAVLPGTTHEGILRRPEWLISMVDAFLAS